MLRFGLEKSRYLAFITDGRLNSWMNIFPVISSEECKITLPYQTPVVPCFFLYRPSIVSITPNVL